jgi:hypothetical protein
MRQPLNPRCHRLWLLLRRWERCQESFTRIAWGQAGLTAALGRSAIRDCDEHFRFAPASGGQAELPESPFEGINGLGLSAGRVGG